MVAFDAGDGVAIYTDGFAVGAPPYTDPPRRWDGRAFVPISSGWIGESNDMRVLDDGTGKRLYVLSVVDGQGRRQMFRWPAVPGVRPVSLSPWEPAPAGLSVYPFPEPGSYIYPEFSTSTPGIAGLYGFMWDFTSGMDRVIRWNEGRHAWESLGGTASTNHLSCMVELQTLLGPSLVVGGGFADFAGFPARDVVRWDGQQWHAMGEAPGMPRAMTVWDAGAGPSLYIGWVPESSQPPLHREGIARWTGTEWVSVGGGMFQEVTGGGSARDMTVFDDGTGPALFVLGRFERAGGPGGTPARNIAKWDGKQWHALGAGVGGFPDHLAIADDGRGSSLFVEGSFSTVGGGTVRNIAQWVGCAGNRQCYADCDNNRILNANDFICYLTKFAAKDPYANCDVSTAAPAINAADFACYLNKFAAGCP